MADFETLKKYWIKAKKSLGQNFLVDDNILDIISSSLEVFKNNILEIWPGFWALTEKLLLQKPKSLHLVELDKEMVSILENRIEKWELMIEWIDFQIFNKDILKFEPQFKNYYLIANIPYYITSPILQKFLYNVENKPEKMLILMQKDVWDKILDGQNKEILDTIQGRFPTTREWHLLKKIKIRSSVLSLFIAKKAFVKEIVRVPSTSFVPAPKVESSVLLFETHDNYKEIEDKKFLEFIKKWFIEPRKKLVNNLTKWWFEKDIILKILGELWFNENIRGEELTLDNWIELYKKNLTNELTPTLVECKKREVKCC